MENLEAIEPIEDDESVNEEKEDSDGKGTAFIWLDKAVMLFLELYRERENEFSCGLKRHNKVWSEIASELKKSNYNVSGVQVQNKMSSIYYILYQFKLYTLSI